MPGVTPPTTAELNALKTKAELMKALRDSYDWQGKVIDSLTEASATEMVAGRGGAMAPRWNAIVSLIVDNMDHYGNLVTYVRLNGLVPPTTAARGRGGRGGQRGGGGPGGPGCTCIAPARRVPPARCSSKRGSGSSLNFLAMIAFSSNGVYSKPLYIFFSTLRLAKNLTSIASKT